jgi:predicted alpha/beta-hydrolase family hydrolase
VTAFDLDTPRGRARVHLQKAAEPRGALILGHGAGGGVAARDLVAASAAAQAAGFTVALVEQPYRVAGRRSPAPAAHLDEAWIAVIGALKRRRLKQLPLIVGGRSSGARVACRTADATGAIAVLCLAFPLIPPGKGPADSRIGELDAVSVPTLVVQGEHDPFGVPAQSGNRTVAVVRGDHSLRTDLQAVTQAVGEWLSTL